MGLTASQNLALALDKNITVTAGAGSGKTRILVDRFIKIALENPHLTKHIVAITFTEKAAGEMQERIAEEVNSRLQNENPNPQERKKLQLIRDQLSSAHISTIHGFCMHILREFPIEAGVTPDFGVLDPIRQQVLLFKAIKDTFKDLDNISSSSQKTDWLSLFLALPRRRVQDMLAATLQKPFEMEVIVGAFQTRTKSEYLDFISAEWFKILKYSVSGDDIKSAALKAKEILDGDPVHIKTAKASELVGILKEFSESWQENAVSVKTASLYLKIAQDFTKSDGQPYSVLTYLGKKESWNRTAQNLIIELSNILSPAQLRIKKLDPGNGPDDTDAQWYDLFMVFIQLYKLTSEKFNQIKLEHGSLDFEDLQLLTVKLLRNKNEIRRKLHDRFKYIMVDEFQDTNPVQWEIVELLSKNENRLAKDKTFIVGDPKQSIYGFRDADIRIFRNVVQLFSSNAGSLFSETYPGNIVFRESFRFLPQLNAFINYYFKQILSEDTDNPFEVGYEDLTSQRDLPGKGSVELAVLDEDEPRLSEADYMARRIKELYNDKAPVFEFTSNGEQSRPLRYGDIAILIRDRSHLLEIEQALRFANIPFKTVGGIGFWQRQEIYDFYHVLRFLANPADDLALVAILRSRLILLPDNIIFFLAVQDTTGYIEKLNLLQNDERLSEAEKNLTKYAFSLINRWLQLRERLSLSELINTILDDTKLLALLNAEFSGDQRTANLRKIIEIADSFDQSGPGGLRSFLDIVDDLINREVSEGEAFLALDDQNSVKIMTIHVSKGLQFPVVFVPYLNRAMRTPGNDVMIDRDLGMAVTFKNEDDYYGDKSGENTLYRLLRIRQKQKEIAEHKRIFYVAVSRASNYLFLSASSKNQKASYNSMFSWLENCMTRDNISPYLDNTIEFKDFTLKIVSSYERTSDEENRSTSFRKQVEYLQQNSFPDSDAERQVLLAEPLSTEMLGRTFSATQIMTFVKNRDEYYQRYHLGFFEDDYKKFGETSNEHSIDSLVKGKIVHRFLELYRQNSINPSDLVEKILLENEIYDHEQQEILSREMLQLYNIMQSSPNGQSVLNAADYRNEISLTMKLGEDFFTGTIDRMQKDGSGNWEIIDYKTNRITENEMAKTAQEYELQIQSYALLLSRLYPQQNVFKVSLYFLKIDKMYSKEFSKSQITKIESGFLDIIKEIKETFPVH